MNVAVIIATCGDEKWAQLASHRAYPSARAVTDGSCADAVIGHYPEASVAGARNDLAADTDADWLCFLDADDELEPGYLAAMGHAYEHKPVGVVGETVPPLLVPMVRRVHKEFIQKIADAFDVPRHLLGEPLASVPNLGRWPQVNECVIGTLVNRQLFDQVGGFRDRIDCEDCNGSGHWTGWSGDDEVSQEGGCPTCHGSGGTDLVMYEDWDLWLRCWDAGAKLVYTVAVYREHVSQGRNTNTHLSQPVYDAIWADHEKRIA